MDAYNILVMELLSLGKLPNGSFQIRIGVARQDGQTIHALEIDDYTYLHLKDALQPLDGGRIRLSPYTKWNPYRSTYYGRLVATTDSLRDTHYFACSEAFRAQLGQLGQAKTASAAPDLADGQEPRTERAGEDAAPGRLRRAFAAPDLRRAARLLVTSGLLLYMGVFFGGGLLTDDAGGAGGQLALVQAAATESAGTEHAPFRLASAAQGPAADFASGAADAPASGEPADDGRYDAIVEIDGETSFFGLPKEYVALTFDDGPSAYTEEIVDILTEHGVTATFLFVGQNAARRPEAVAYASERGMSIGNHSWDHSVMTKADREEQTANLAKTSELLEAITDTTITLFRPPYGAIDDGLVEAAKEQRMKILLWNRDPEDWNAKSQDDIIDYFREVAAPGGVYVLHEDRQTVEALPDIIAYLKEKELKFAAFK